MLANLSDFAAPALYITTSVTSALIEIWIGSLSEYRFPYPCATTQLHLLLGLVILVSLRLGSSLWSDAGRSKGRLARPPASEMEGAKRPRHAATHPSVEHASKPPQKNKMFYAHALAGLSWTGVLVVEVYAREHVDPAFWSLVQLGPLLLTIALAWASTGRSGPLRLSISIFAGLLVLGWSLDAVKQAPWRDWLVGLVWSTASLTWVRALRVTIPLELRGESRSPLRRDSVFRLPVLIDWVIMSLLIGSLCCLPLLWTSGEIASIQRYRHIAFFTEAGFWAQELGMAVCGTVRLLTFHYLISSCDPIAIFTTIALKHRLQPEILHRFLRNPQIRPGGGEAPLSANLQYASVVALAGIALSFRLFSLSETRSHLT